MSTAIAVRHGKFGRAGLYYFDRPLVAHAHRNGQLIFYLSGSDCSVSTASGEIKLSDKVCCAVNPWELHNFHLENRKNPVQCLAVDFDPSWFANGQRYGEKMGLFGDNEIVITDEIKSYIVDLSRSLLSNDSIVGLESSVFSLFNACYRKSMDQRRSVGALDDPKAMDFRVKRSIEILEEDFSRDLNIEDLARKSGISRPHLFKLFKQQVGVTPNIYLATVRMEKAVGELLQTDKTVTDISHDLGFASQASFTRFFSSNTGVPPSEFRRAAGPA